MSQLELRGVAVVLSNQTIIEDISLSLPPGCIGCVVGPSGCGKTTLLRAIAGFEVPTSGQVVIGGEEVSRAGWALAPERRRIGMVFQDFALFPNLSVRDNIAFGLKDLSSRERVGRVDELLRLVGLTQVGNVYPHRLSGGQQQRVALARALAPKPAILLLDEPFSSMDAELREQLAREVRDILYQAGITAIFVTHNQFEAFAVADEIGVMNSGRLLQWDSGYNLYHHPADRFVADFIGQGVFLPGTVLDDQHVQISLGIIPGNVNSQCERGGLVDVLIRPDDIAPDDHAPLRATVIDKIFQGATFRYTLRMQDGTEVFCVVPSHSDHELGDEIGVRLDTQHLVAFPRAA